MATFTDLLPPTKTDPKGAGIDRMPSAGDGPKAGTLVIKQKRVYTTYAVQEFPTQWDGRASTSRSSPDGSDIKTEERYSCFLARNGQTSTVIARASPTAAIASTSRHS